MGGEQLAQKDLQVRVDSELNVSTSCVFAVKAISILGSGSTSVAGRFREVSLPFCLNTAETRSRVLCPVWGFPVEERQ